jgi:hypothetical protein
VGCLGKPPKDVENQGFAFEIEFSDLARGFGPALAAMGTSPNSLLPADLDYRLDWRVLGFTVGVSLLTGVLFGLAPAWRTTSQDLTSAMKLSSRGSSAIARSRLSKALVILQVAMSLVLLIGAGLFLRTLRNLEHVNLGFNQENLLLFTLKPEAVGYKDEKLVQFYQQLFARLDALPGVHSASFANVPLIAHYVNNTSLILSGETEASTTEHSTNRQVVRANYFATMEIPLVIGRGFNEHDDQHSQRVAVISETLARKYFANQTAIGQRVGFDDKSAGKIEIEYYTSSDLDRIYSLIMSVQEIDNLTAATASPGL